MPITMRLDSSRPGQGLSRLPLSWPAIAAILLIFAHIVVLVLFGHSPSVSLPSDCLVLSSALFAMVVCFLATSRSHGITRPFWYLAALTFALWSLGNCFLLYDLYYLGLTTFQIVPHLLFFLAAAPMFVTFFLSDEDFGDRISWEWILDAFQILGLVIIIYLFVVYIPLLRNGEKVVTPIEGRLFFWRNLLLAGGFLARAIFSRSRYTWRVYLAVAAAVGVYAGSTWIANRAQGASNAPEMAWYDLAWSVPFSLVALAATLWRESPEKKRAQTQIPTFSRVIFAYLPALVLPILLLVNYRQVFREQIFLGLFGLMFSIVLFNARLVLTLRRQRLTMEALHSAEHQYHSLFERNMAGVFRSTIGGKLLDCNPAFAKMLGYAREELRDIPTSELYFGGAEERNRRILELRRDGPLQPSEARIRCKDGSTLWVVQSLNLEKQPNGSELLEGTVVDITERRSLEAQFRQAQKMEAVGRLAGGVAHDFNNLLTVISGYSTMLLESASPSDPVHHQAEQIKAAAERAASLTRQLLAFSRQQVLQPRIVNLNDIVRDVDKMLRRLIGEDVEVLTVLAPNLGTVKVDPGQIDQVLMNLVVNARDAMPGGGKLTIQTQNVDLDESYARKRQSTSPGRYVLLAVSDSGTGMTPETQARLFEPFFTTKEAGKGTGLGLSMVYGIVKQSGGSIEVYSELNHGTTMKIYLPRADAAVEEVTSSVGRSNHEHGSERILLVEDDVHLRQLVVDILTGRGYIVEAVENPEELEGMLQRTPECALLLTDVVMPKLNGRELAKRVTRHWPGIKVLYMSGYTTDAIVHHGVLDEGLFFLQKPFTPTTLVAKVREVLDVPSRPGTQP